MIDKYFRQIAVYALIAVPSLLVIGRGLGDAAISLIALLFLIRSFQTRDFSWLQQTWVKAFLLLWAYLIVRAIFTEDPLAALARALPFGRYGVFAAALAGWLLKESAEQNRLESPLLLGLALPVGLLSLDGFLQFVFHIDILGQSIAADSLRIKGPFSMPRLGHTLLPFALPLVLVLIVQTKLTGEGSVRKIAQPCMLYALATAPLGIILISGDRTPLVLTIVGLGLIFLIGHAAIRWRLLILGLIGCVLMGTVFLTQPRVLERQFISTVSALTNAGSFDYFRVWQDGFQMVKENPVFGVGPHHYRIECKKPEFQARSCNMHPHNIYLELASEGGLVGLALMLALAGSLAKAAFTGFSRWRSDGLRLGLLSVVLIYLWPLIGGPGFFANWHMIPFWAAFGWLLALHTTPPGSNQRTLRLQRMSHG